jgi:hypothetical protein
MKRLLVGLVVVAGVFGMKFYNKSSDHDEVRARLVELCAGDERCLGSVETHFEGCFESSYKLGGRRQSAHLDADGFVSCMNSRAGKPYFSAREQ